MQWTHIVWDCDSGNRLGFLLPPEQKPALDECDDSVHALCSKGNINEISPIFPTIFNPTYVRAMQPAILTTLSCRRFHFVRELVESSVHVARSAKFVISKTRKTYEGWDYNKYCIDRWDSRLCEKCCEKCCSTRIRWAHTDVKQKWTFNFTYHFVNFQRSKHGASSVLFRYKL